MSEPQNESKDEYNKLVFTQSDIESVPRPKIERRWSVGHAVTPTAEQSSKSGRPTSGSRRSSRQKRRSSTGRTRMELRQAEEHHPSFCGITNAFYHSSNSAPTPFTVAKREGENSLKQPKDEKSIAAVDFIRQFCTEKAWTSKKKLHEETPREAYVSYRNENLKRRKSWDSFGDASLNEDVERAMNSPDNRLSRCFFYIQDSFGYAVSNFVLNPKVLCFLILCLVVAICVGLSPQGKRSIESPTPNIGSVNITIDEGNNTNGLSHDQEVKIMISILQSSPLINDSEKGAYNHTRSPQHKAIVWVTSKLFPSSFTKLDEGKLIKPGDGLLMSVMFGKKNGLPSGTFDEYFRLQAVLERYALAVLYFSTIGKHQQPAEFDTNINQGTFWLSNKSVCDWKGIICHEFEDIVTGLDLSDRQLSGTIPSELVYLRSLKSIDFSNNSLYGEVPESFGTYPEIESIKLHNNSLTGTMPEVLCTMVNKGYIGTLTSDCAKDGHLSTEGVDCNCCTLCT